MKKTITILTVLIVIDVLIWTFFLKNKLVELNIKKEISKANYCEKQDDCQIVLAQCPFNCFAPVNKKEANRISTMIENYESTCIYICVEHQGVDCINNKCEVILSK